jgi:pimeloyl-ACP methyl ester carboxylesterase
MPSATEPRSLRLGDFDCRYLETGAGPPLLLVHGSLCDYRYWRPQLEALAAARRLIVPSLRHCWPEQWDGSGGGFNPQQHAADLAALIEALGAGPVDLLGHSRGGAVAWLLARQRPELLRSLILAEPGMALRGEEQLATTMDRGNFRQRARELLRGGDADAALTLFVDTVSGDGTWARMVPWLKRMMRDNVNTLIGQAAERYPEAAPDEAASLQMPVLLLGGEQSPPPYPALLDALRGWMPQAQRAVIGGASHAMNLWNPAAFNRVVLDFLSQ